MGLFDLFREGGPPLVEEAFENVTNMLSDGHHMFESATAFALDNEILNEDLSAADEDINRCEQELRRSLLEHLTVNPNREMVFSLKLISIVGEAERIGDIAKSIVKAGRLAHKPRMGPHVEPLRDLRDRLRKMFDLAKEGLWRRIPRPHGRS